VVSGFRCGVKENLLFGDVTPRRVANYRRFGATNGSHPQESSSPTNSSWTAWPLKVVPTGCSETSVTTNLRCVTSPKCWRLLYVYFK